MTSAVTCAAKDLQFLAYSSLRKQAKAVNSQVPHRVRQAARLLHKLRALERQRRGNALPGRCLRLGARISARLVHLGRAALSKAS